VAFDAELVEVGGLGGVERLEREVVQDQQLDCGEPAHLGIQASVVTASCYDWNQAAEWCGRTMHLPLRPNVLGTIVATCQRLREDGVRVLLTGGMPDQAAPRMMLRSLAGGFLLQEGDRVVATPNTLKTVTKRAPSAAEINDLIFADTVAKHVKSNAIVFAKHGATVGIGAGQPSRVDSSKIAVAKAGDMQKAAGLAVSPVKGAVMASDAFFPFADGLEVGIEAGITAVIQSGGSRRDDEVIAAADKAGIAMVFTGIRHFRH